MSSIPDSEPTRMDASNQNPAKPENSGPTNNSNRSNYGRKGSRGPWAGLDKETQERYAAIEKRCVEKWGKL